MIPLKKPFFLTQPTDPLLNHLPKSAFMKETAKWLTTLLCLISSLTKHNSPSNPVNTESTTPLRSATNISEMSIFLETIRLNNETQVYGFYYIINNSSNQVMKKSLSA